MAIDTATAASYSSKAVLVALLGDQTKAYSFALQSAQAAIKASLLTLMPCNITAQLHDCFEFNLKPDLCGG